MSKLISSPFSPAILVDEAFQLLKRIDRDIQEARAQWNVDWFRRLMRLRPKAVRRLQRRWDKVCGKTLIPLGSLRRQYHANISLYLYEPRK